MKASIIIPTYQRTVFLRDTLKSVIAQNFPKEQYEVLIVDNAAKPTPELAALSDVSIFPSINYVHEPKNGLHNARHAGAKAARGEILVYIDDDVICPSEWLAAMVAPYSNQKVAMVAGKVILHYETEPPAWLFQFSSILSALDLGDTLCMVEPYGSPVGCNMSVRKSVLFDVGGFNPDGFGDRSLIRYRGDGECGLARKIHDAGLGVWYAPDALLEHRVPESRMSIKYIERRAENSGIEVSYRVYRYECNNLILLLKFWLKFAIKGLYHRILMWTKRRGSTAWFRHRASSFQHFYSVCQCLRLLHSRGLRDCTKTSTYFR